MPLFSNLIKNLIINSILFATIKLPVKINKFQWYSDISKSLKFQKIIVEFLGLQ